MRFVPRWGFCSLLAIGALASGAHGCQPASSKASSGLEARAAVDYRSLAEALWETVNREFFDPWTMGINFRGVRDRYLPLFESVTSEAEFLDLGNRMIRELGTSHLDVLPPEGFVERQLGGRVGTVTQKFRRTGDGMVYDATAPGLAAEGFRPGDELLSPPQILSGRVGTEAVIRLRGCDGAEREVAVRYIVPPGLETHSWSRIEHADRDLLYVKIHRFNDDTLAFTNRLMAAAAQSDGMIIDIRGNSGGSISALYLANQFMTDVQQPVVTMMGRGALERLGRWPTEADLARVPRTSGLYRARDVLRHLQRHGQATFMSEPRGRGAYQKPVAVLTNGRTGSAAEGFARMMKEGTHAIIIGRPTAGALVRGHEFNLPHGWQVTVPVFGLWGPRGERVIDQRVEPHLLVEWQQADYCLARDPDMQAAFASLFSGPRR